MPPSPSGAKTSSGLSAPPTLEKPRSLHEKIEYLKRQLFSLETSIKSGFPAKLRSLPPSAGNQIDFSSFQLFKPLQPNSVPTMRQLLEDRDENLQQQKIAVFEEYIKDLLRHFHILISVKDILKYAPAHLAYAEQDRARECLVLAEDVLRDIRKLEQLPTFRKISDATKDDVDVIHFLLAELRQAIDEVKPPPIQKQSFAQVQQCLITQYSTLRQDSSDIQELLKKRKVRYLYHLTDRRNIATIRYHQGLYARTMLDELDIVPESPGTTHLSKNIDSDRHTAGYVHLYLTENQRAFEQMRNRGLDPGILRINPRVASLQSTEFADSHLGNADLKITSQTTDYLEFIDRCTASFDAGMTFWKSNNHESEAIVLVKNGIPKEYIQNINDFA